jgi:predicted ribosome quality control (RQC) complex YloA/Tae2 family protein
MQLDYTSLNECVIKIDNNFFKDKNYKVKVQKIYSTPHFVSLKIRIPGASHFINIGRGNNFQGIWQTEEDIKKEYRVRDNFLNYLRKYLQNSLIGKIELDAKDRIVTFTYWVNSKPNYLTLFWKGPKLYFSNIYANSSKNYQLFTSWNAARSEKLELEFNYKEINLKIYDIIGRKECPKDNEKIKVINDDFLEDYYKNIFSSARFKKENVKKVSFLDKKVKNIRKDLLKISLWREIKALIENENYNLDGSDKFNYKGIKVKLNKDWNHFKKQSVIYEKIKSLKKAEVIQEKRLNDVVNSHLHQKKQKTLEDINVAKIVRPIWNKSIGLSVKEDVNFSKFIMPDGIGLGIGKNTKENDHLRNSWSHKDDIWFHIEGYKGAHAIIKIKYLSDITPDILELIGSALRDISKLEINSIPLIFTHVKNLKGVKGRPGAVNYKNEKHRVTNYNSQWRERISSH